MKKNQLSIKSIILLVVAGVAIGVGGSWVLIGPADQKTTPEVADVEETPVPEETPEPVEEVTSASLFFVGDSLLHLTIPRDAKQADGSYDFSRLMGRVGKIASNYDLRYYNQETILGGDELGLHGYPTFNSPRAFGETMVNDYGFNLVSTANNHSLDMGIGGLTSSINYWNSKENVNMSGTYLSQEDREDLNIHEINGIKYAFFSWTYGMNGFQCPEDKSYMVACFDGHEKEMVRQIQKAKKKADVVIVAMHWGAEYQMIATDEQKRVANEVAEAGADIIIGNHPHCIGPVEWLNDHKTICFYAMGNVCAAQYDLSRIEMMGALNIKKTTKGEDVKIEIEDVKADLMYCYCTSSWTNFEVVPFAQMEDDSYIANHEAVYEEYKKVIHQLDDTIEIGGMKGV